MGNSSPWLAAINTFNANYLVLVIVLVGMMGNLLALAVFVFTPLRRISSSVYFAALALTDFAFLVLLGMRWLENDGPLDLPADQRECGGPDHDRSYICNVHKEGPQLIQLPMLNPTIMCPLATFVTNVSSFLSIWYIVAFTAGPYTSMYRSRLHKQLCKPKRSLVLSISLAGLACLIYLFLLFYSQNIEIDETINSCMFAGSIYFGVAASIADTLLSLIIPFSLLLFMDIRILFTLTDLCNKIKNKNRETPSSAPDKSSPNAGTSLDSGCQSDECDDRDMPVIEPHSALTPSPPPPTPKTHSTHSTAMHNKFRSDRNPDRRQGREDEDDERIMTKLLSNKSCKDHIVGVRDSGKKPQNTDTMIRVEYLDNPTTRTSKPSGIMSVMLLQRKCFKIVICTLMILLVINLPCHGMRLIILCQGLFYPDVPISELVNQIYQLSQTIYYLNFVVNLFTYVTCARRFQKGCIQLPVYLAQVVTSGCRRTCIGKCFCKEGEDVSSKGSSRLKPKSRGYRRKFNTAEHSRLVEICISALHLSQIRSFGSDFKLASPPCLLKLDPSSVGGGVDDDSCICGGGAGGIIEMGTSS